MALWKGKTEHAGDKGSSRKHGFWGTRAEAKRATKKQRRADDTVLESLREIHRLVNDDKEDSR